jgi:hypothetical protein
VRAGCVALCSASLIFVFCLLFARPQPPSALNSAHAQGRQRQAEITEATRLAYDFIFDAGLVWKTPTNSRPVPVRAPLATGAPYGL